MSTKQSQMQTVNPRIDWMITEWIDFDEKLLNDALESDVLSSLLNMLDRIYLAVGAI